MNKFDEMVMAINDARQTMNAADRLATDLARILVGRLKKVNSNYLLVELKKELRDFNMHTGQWK